MRSKRQHFLCLTNNKAKANFKCSLIEQTVLIVNHYKVPYIPLWQNHLCVGTLATFKKSCLMPKVMFL